MNHADHIDLLREGIPESGGRWADLGAGRGAFTLALAELVNPAATIYAVDKDAGALRRLRQRVHQKFPTLSLQTLQADFTGPLELPPLEGIVMANALHFITQKVVVVRRLRQYLQQEGRLILVEYEKDRGNR
mgnify:CR=1 FL=1